MFRRSQSASQHRYQSASPETGVPRTERGGLLRLLSSASLPQRCTGPSHPHCFHVSVRRKSRGVVPGQLDLNPKRLPSGAEGFGGSGRPGLATLQPAGGFCAPCMTNSLRRSFNAASGCDSRRACPLHCEFSRIFRGSLELNP